MTAKEIRESFKKFFESKEHLIVPSAPSDGGEGRPNIDVYQCGHEPV